MSWAEIVRALRRAGAGGIPTPSALAGKTLQRVRADQNGTAPEGPSAEVSGGTGSAGQGSDGGHTMSSDGQGKESSGQR